MRTNDRCLHTHTADRANLPILRVAQLIIYLTLRDLTGSYLCQLPPIILVESPQATADGPMLRRGNALTNSIGIMFLQIILLQQRPQHVLVVLDCGPAASPVAVRVAVGLQLLVPILLPHSRLFAFQLQLLVPLLLDHVVGPLVQAHAPLLRLDLVLDQA